MEEIVKQFEVLHAEEYQSLLVERSENFGPNEIE